MISATYFGEITELDSRAVWYSDEEDEDDDDIGIKAGLSTSNRAAPASHEALRSNIQLNFQENLTNISIRFTTCIISLSSQYKNIKLNDSSSIFLGNLDSVGKALAYPIGGDNTGEYLLWLLLDSTHQYMVGHEVGYLVEALREKIYNQFQFPSDGQIIILSQTHSSSEHLEYLVNCPAPTKLQFTGRPLLPPSLITNQFESSLFEQLTLSLKLATVVCLPDPKNFWFDKSKDWPMIPNQIIETKLKDDNLDKTLIFT